MCFIMATTFWNFGEGLRELLLCRSHVTHDAILYDPFEKVELCDSCGYTIKLNTLSATERIK
jgi:hypothetical protein